MMKRKSGRLLFSLCMVFILIVSGCGSSQPAGQSTATAAPSQPAQGTAAGQDGQPSGTAAGTEGMGDRLSKAYTDIFQGDRYFMKYRTIMDMDGEDVEAQIEMAVDGDMMAMKTLLPGVESHMINKDEKMYMVDHNTKTVMVMNIASAPDMEDPDQYTAGISYIGDGTGDFLGRSLPFEEYAVETGTIKYFFDGKALAGMIFHTQAGDQVMEILEISDKVPEEMFDIPENYPQTTIGG